MNVIAINFSDFIQVQNNQTVTTSEFIATAFKKRHDNIIRDIDNLLAEIPADFAAANFREVDVMRDNPLTGGKTKSRAFELTKDGFMLLVMGFTGKAALAIKIAYIKAFNAMAQKLSAPALPNNTVENRKGLVAAVRQLAQKNGMSYPNAFHLVHQRFNVESVEQLSVAQVAQATEYIHALMLHTGLLGDLLDKPAEPMATTVDDELVLAMGRLLFHAQDMRLFVKRYLSAFCDLGLSQSGALWSFVHETEPTFKMVRSFFLEHNPQKLSALTCDATEYVKRQVIATAAV